MQSVSHVAPLEQPKDTDTFLTLLLIRNEGSEGLSKLPSVPVPDFYYWRDCLAFFSFLRIHKSKFLSSLPLGRATGLILANEMWSGGDWVLVPG